MASATHRRLRIRFGLSLSERTNRPYVHLEIDAGTTAAELRERLCERIPTLGPLLGSALVVAGDRVLSAGQVVPEGEEVTLLLPMAGG